MFLVHLNNKIGFAPFKQGLDLVVVGLAFVFFEELFSEDNLQKTIKIPEDFMMHIFSHDLFRKKFVFRQFHIEGFINQYVLESISDDGKTLVFDSEEFENAPPGWKARITYKILNDDTLEESFDLATPGKDLQCYILNTLKRKK